MAVRKSSSSSDESPVRGRRARSRSTSRSRNTSRTKKNEATPRRTTRSRRTARASPSKSRSRSPLKIPLQEGSPLKPLETMIRSAASSSSATLRRTTSRVSSASGGSLSDMLRPYGYESQRIRRFYFLTYNLVSFLLWSYLLIRMSKALIVDRMIDTVFTGTKAAGIGKLASASWWHNLCTSSQGIYDIIGLQLGIVQALAFLEIVHAFLGWTPSKLLPTILQVLTRNFTIWVVCIFKGTVEVRHHPAFALMGITWALTEVIRYAYYFCQLECPKCNKCLTWLRYTLCLALYPFAFGSEILLCQALIRSAPSSVLPDCCRHMFSVMLFGYLPVFHILYGHMVDLRKKKV